MRSAAEDTCAQVDSAGGAMVFFSWSPNAESLSLPESASSSHAFWEAGRSEDFLYHSACTSGLLTHWMNFHADCLFLESLNVTRSLPPTKDVAGPEDSSIDGRTTVAYLDSNPSPPNSLIWLTAVGPCSIIGVSPDTKFAMSAPELTSALTFATPSL